MKTVKIYGKFTKKDDYIVGSAIEINSGLEIDTPSFLANLLRVKTGLRKSIKRGFEYVFPLSFDPQI